MINRTDAWKCSDGRCFPIEAKEEAYKYEIKTLLQSMPKGIDKQVTTFHLEKLKKEAEKWLLLAKDFTDGVKRTPRDRGLLIVKDFQEVVNLMKEWVESSSGLLGQVETEPNVETKRKMSG